MFISITTQLELYSN